MVFLAGALTLSIFQTRVMSTTLGLVGYWRFDEGSGTVAGDSSGNGNTGTLTNGPQWVKGVSGNALQFDGLDDYVAISSSSSLTIPGNQITVELWIKPSITMDNNYPYTNIIDYGNEYGFQINRDALQTTPDGKIWFYVAIRPFPPAANWKGVQTRTNQWAANTWYYLVGTYDGAYVKIYVNGVLENSVPASGNLNSQGSYPLSIGSYCLGRNTFFAGAIDEVKVYNYARTAESISNDYNSFMQNSPTPFWAQWWFWIIAILSFIAGLSIFTALYYRKNALKSKETRTAASKATSKEYIICPNCNAQLPINSKFCGKCGTSLE